MADPFWDDSAMMLISSLIAYVKETIPEESGMHNFHMILEILRAAGRDDSDSRNSILANMMENLHKKIPQAGRINSSRMSIRRRIKRSTPLS